MLPRVRQMKSASPPAGCTPFHITQIITIISLYLNIKLFNVLLQLTINMYLTKLCVGI